MIINVYGSEDVIQKMSYNVLFIPVWKPESKGPVLKDI